MYRYILGYVSYESSAELQHRHGYYILLQIRQTYSFFFLRFLYNVCLTFYKNSCSSYSCIKFATLSSAHSLLLLLLILKEFLRINRHKCLWDIKMSSNSDGRYETGWSRCIHLTPLLIAVQVWTLIRDCFQDSIHLRVEPRGAFWCPEWLFCLKWTLTIRGTGVYCKLDHNFWKSVCMMVHHAICGFHGQ